MKSIFQSKTFWLNIVASVLAVLTLPWVQQLPANYLPYITLATTALNVLLRRLSNTNVVFAMPRNVLLSILLLGVVYVSTTASMCPHAPPNLNPHAQIAFHNTQVLKVLDLIRDTAIDANAQTPPLVSTATTRELVQFHETTITLMNAAVTGWASTAYHSLIEIQKRLPANEQATLGAYFTLGVTTLKGLF